MTQEARAFELRDAIDSELFGGSVTLPDGTAFDVGAALAEGNGLIVSSDVRVIGALDVFEPLKRAVVPAEVRGYDAQTKPELEGEIVRRNTGRADDDKIVVDQPANKPQIIAALEADDANVIADGDENGGDGENTNEGTD